MKWEKIEIGKLGTVITGNTPPRKNPELYGDHTPFIKPTDIEIDRRYTPHPDECYSELGFEKYKKSLIPKGSTCVVTIGSIGKKITQAISDCFINQAMNAVIPYENYNKDFVFYLLKNNLNQVKGLDSGTSSGRENVSKSSFSSIEVKVPSLPTQHRIASLLSAYDDLIENNLKRIKLLEEKAFLSYKEIVRIEKELKKLPLAQLATVTSSKRIFLSDYVEEGIPFYRSKEIIAKSNFESIQKPLFIAEERFTDIKEKFGVPLSGDLLITSVGTIGFIHLVNDNDGDFYFKDGNLIWIKNLNQPNYAYFLFFKFRTPEFREMLNSVAIGSSQKALTIETVKKIEIEIPSDESLNDFNQVIKTIIELIYNLQNQNTKLREARDILLPKLMNGQIEV